MSQEEKLRENAAILKKPSIAETLDWAAALEALGITELTRETLEMTGGFVLKNSEDLEEIHCLLNEEEGEAHHHHAG